MLRLFLYTEIEISSFKRIEEESIPSVESLVSSLDGIPRSTDVSHMIVHRHMSKFATEYRATDSRLTTAKLLKGRPIIRVNRALTFKPIH